MVWVPIVKSVIPFISFFFFRKKGNVTNMIICLWCYEHLQDHEIAASGHRSLAGHLGASLIDSTFDTPDKLSEDVVTCISSIYCKLANPPQIPAALSDSPTTSASSSSIFSSKHPCDSCNEDTSAVNLQGSAEDNGPYAATTEVLKISLDDENFNDAAIMLQNFRWWKFLVHVYYLGLLRDKYICMCIAFTLLRYFQHIYYDKRGREIFSFITLVHWFLGHWFGILRRLTQGRWSVKRSLHSGSIFTTLWWCMYEFRKF